MADLPLGGARPVRLVRDKATGRRPRKADLETLVQEELSAEVVALSAAVLDLLRDRGYVEEPDVTEDLTLEATEMILFAAMNCARHIVGATGLRHIK
jgi:hypothetical protein